MHIASSLALLALTPSLVWAADPKIPGYEGKTKRVLERAFKEYRALESYQDRALRKTDYELEGDADALPPAMTKEQESTFSFAKPGKFAMDSGVRRLTCDGETVWIYMTKLQQYTESPAPEAWTIDDGADSLQSKGVAHRPAYILLTKLTPSTVFKDVVKFEPARSEKRNGQNGTVISGQMRLSRTNNTEVRFEYWFNDQTGLLEESANDMTEVMASSIKRYEESYGVKIKKVTSRLRYADIKTNPKNLADLLSFKPGADDEKVDKFTSNTQERMAKQQELVGKPAPAFAGKSLEGKDVALADYKGKVVMLDFWATWCGPCVAYLPTVQKLHERFRDKDVVILGMNSDEGNAKKAVSSFLKEKELSFPQFMNAKEKAMEAYGVVGIPCSVFIDRQGVIRAIQSGGHAEEQVAEMIDALLAGRDLAELARKQKEKEDSADKTAQAEKGEAKPAQVALEESTPERISPRQIEAEGPLSYPKEIDVNGDGRAELVAATRDGKLVVIKGDREKAETIKLERREDTRPLNGFAVVRGREGVRWFVASGARRTPGGIEPGRVSLHEADGTRVWDYEIKTVKDHTHSVQVDAGDLDGDGSAELVATVTYFKAAARGIATLGRGSSRAQLMIFSGAGQLLSSRNVGSTVQKMQVVSPGPAGRPGQVVIIGDRGSVSAYSLLSGGSAAVEIRDVK